MQPGFRKFIPPLGARPASARQKVLSLWRRWDVAEEERSSPGPNRAPAELLPSVLGKLRIDQREAETEILRAWNNLLDPQITTHAQPTGIRKGTLFVQVDSSPWLSEILRYRNKEILSRLQNAFGKTVIQRISYRAG